MRVDLNAGEMHVCRLIGFLRRSINLNKTKDQQVGKQDPWEILKLNDINNHTTQIKVLYE